MMRFSIRLSISRAAALGGLALAWASAPAAPIPPQLGESASLQLSLTTSIRYDDNIFLAASDQRSDTILSVAPGAVLNWGEEVATHVGLVAQKNFVRYLRDSAPDDSLTSVQVSGGMRGARTNFTVAAGFDEILGNTRDLRGSSELARHDHTTADLSVAREFTARTSLQTGLALDHDEYLTGGYDSTRTTSLPLTLSYVLSPKVNLLANYSYQDVTIGGSDQGFVDHLLGLGASGEFTSKLSGRLGGNWTRHAPSVAPTDNTLGFDCSLAWAATARMSWAATAARSFRASAATGSDYASTRFGLNHSWALAEFWSTQAGVQYEGAAYADGRRDRLVVTSLSINYAPSMFATFSASWIVERNRSNAALTDYDRSAMNFSATLHY